MMVRMKTAYSGSDAKGQWVSVGVGEMVDVSEATGKRLIERGLAEAVAPMRRKRSSKKGG